jgi:hypothetical protein
MYQFEVVLKSGRKVTCFADDGLEVCMKCPNAVSFKLVK